MPLGGFADRTFAKRELLAVLQDVATKKQRESSQQQQQHRKAPAEVTDLYQNWPGTESIRAENGDMLPTWIQFPYARHSSLGELRNFVAAFRPRDVHQNTVDEDAWSEATSVERLYGHLCSANLFSHDAQMRRICRSRMEEQQACRLRIQQLELESQSKGRLEALEVAMNDKQSGEDERGAGLEHWSGAAPSLPHTSPRARSEITPPPLSLTIERGEPDSAGRVPELPSSPPLPPVPLFPPRPRAPLSPPPPPTTTPTATAATHNEGAPSERALPAHSLPDSPRASGNNLGSISGLCKRLSQPSSDDIAAVRAPKLARLGGNKPSAVTMDIEPMDNGEEDIPPRGRRGVIEDLRFADCLAKEVVEGDNSLDLDLVEEAVCAALEIDAEGWWGIELESTKRRWRYEREVEL